MGVAEEHALLGDPVDRGRADDIVDAAGAIDLGKQRGVAAPVVCEEKENVGPFGHLCSRCCLQARSWQKHGRQHHRRQNHGR